MTPNDGRTPLVMVWSRDINGAPSFGRLRTMSLVKAAGDELGAVHFRLRNIAETKSIRLFLKTLSLFIRRIISGRPIALQIALFSDDEEIEGLVREIGALGPSVIYLDSIRLETLQSKLRTALPNSRIVMDFDDLMSRRIEIYRKAGLSIGLGYLVRILPAWLAKISRPFLKLSWLMRFEESALLSAEQSSVEFANAIVLVSETEARLLRQSLPESEGRKIYSIAPPVAAEAKAVQTLEPYRFCFVGSDDLIQNQLSIDYLLSAWKRLAPPYPLRIVGRMRRTYSSPPPNVQFDGFVENLKEAISGHIMLVPSFIGGGIKTKVLEGFGSGCPVVGTHLAFEGLALQSYPLSFDVAVLEQLIQAPHEFAEQLIGGAAQALEYARNELSVELFHRRWVNLLTGQVNGK